MTGYKGVECQSLTNDTSLKNIPDDLKNFMILDKRLEQYKIICQRCAPFPLNYLGRTKETEMLSVIIGFLIHEGVIK